MRRTLSVLVSLLGLAVACTDNGSGLTMADSETDYETESECHAELGEECDPPDTCPPGASSEGCDGPDPEPCEPCGEGYVSEPGSCACEPTCATGEVTCSDNEACRDIDGPGVCEAIPSEMVNVPAGSFWMGCQDVDELAPGYDPTCSVRDGVGDPIANASPYHEVYVDAFYIDKYEVTTDEFVDCVVVGQCRKADIYNAGGTAQNGTREGGGTGRWPINLVTQSQAREYCDWRGKVLPTEAQWEKAARGGCELYPTDCAGLTPRYPWGNDAPDPTQANYGRPQSQGYPTFYPVGTYNGGARPDGSGPTIDSPSPYGAYDMVGNAWEMVADKFSWDYYCAGNSTTSGEPITPTMRPEACGPFDEPHPDVTENPEGPTSQTQSVGYYLIRGGSSANDLSRLSPSFRGFAYNIDVPTTAVGFRCAVSVATGNIPE